MLNKNEELLKGCEWLEEFEDYRGEIYLDTEGIETVGIGRNLEVYPFDEEELKSYETEGSYGHTEAVAWAYDKLSECRKNITIHNPWLVEHPPEVRLIVTDMTYNMGLKGVLKFKNMFRALKVGDYHQAALELEDSKYFKQTGQRALHHYRELLKLG